MSNEGELDRLQLPVMSTPGNTEQTIQLQDPQPLLQSDNKTCHEDCKCNSRIKRCQLALDVSILTMFILSLIMVIIITVQSGYLSASVPSQVKEINTKLQEVQVIMDDMHDVLLFIVEVIQQQQKPEMKVYQHIPYVGQSE